VTTLGAVSGYKNPSGKSDRHRLSVRVFVSKYARPKALELLHIRAASKPICFSIEAVNPALVAPHNLTSLS